MRVWHFRFYTVRHGAIVSTVEAETKKDAEGKAWAQVLRKYPDAIHHRTELLT